MSSWVWKDRVQNGWTRGRLVDRFSRGGKSIGRNSASGAINWSQNDMVIVEQDGTNRYSVKITTKEEKQKQREA
jgi:hypothetical protein